MARAVSVTISSSQPPLTPSPDNRTSDRRIGLGRTSRKVRVYVFDGSALLRLGLRHALDAEPDMTVIGASFDAATIVEDLRAALPDVVLMDVDIADCDGVELCGKILAALPKLAILGFTSRISDGLVLRTLVAGAKGYLLKDTDIQQLKTWIRTAAAGRFVLDPRITDQVISKIVVHGRRARNGGSLELPSVLFSAVDTRIIRLVSEGLTNDQIAARVNLSPHTVKDHVCQIMEYLDVRTRAALAAAAVKRGLI